MLQLPNEQHVVHVITVPSGMKMVVVEQLAQANGLARDIAMHNRMRFMI